MHVMLIQEKINLTYKEHMTSLGLQDREETGEIEEPEPCVNE